MLLAIDELRRLEKLAVQPTVAHFDHRIRKTSSRDARWVSESAKRLGYPVTVGRAKVADVAKAESDNLEQVARRLRYEFLERTAKKHSAHFVLTAHTMDDQAETVLLRLMRGSADVGLSGMDGLRPLRRGSEITLARPLLWARREETVDYCHHSKAEYLTDEMNDDETFARVKVRKQLLPLMQSFNSRIVEAISRTATQLREDSHLLSNDADELLRRASVNEETPSKTPILNVNILSGAPAALRRRALRQWISEARGNTRRLEMVHLVAVDRLLDGDSGGRIVELPGGSRVRRKRGRLVYEAEND
jgi:tRNA(Ile)-lysidine synthase